MNSPSKYDVMSSIASRKREMDEIRILIKELIKKIKNLNQRYIELKSLNYLDDNLLKELEENGT